jgi:HD superfamily phosphodiesterase
MNIDKKIENVFLTETLKALGLVEVAVHVSLYNPSGYLGYHNNDHLFGVTALCNNLYKVREGRYNEHDHKVLLCSALLHDVNHTGGHGTDVLNISQAKEFIEHMSDNDFVSNNKDAIFKLIEVTEYPFIVEPVTDMQKILRDADLLYSLRANTGSVIIDGLRSEMEIARDRPITRKQMFDGQREFMATVKMFTPIGKEIWDEFYKEALDLQKLYVHTANNDLSCVETA